MRRDDIDSWDASGSNSDGDDLIFLDETLPTVGDADAVQLIGFSSSGSSDGQDKVTILSKYSSICVMF